MGKNAFLAAQTEEYGILEKFVDKSDVFSVGADKLLYQFFGQIEVRMVVPATLKQKLLRRVHGIRAAGHSGLLRASAR